MNSSRTRAWRRAQRNRCVAKRQQQIRIAQQRKKYSFLHGHLADGPGPDAGRLAKASITQCGYWALRKPSKQWKLLWLRSQKVSRSKQLKTFYPRKFWELEIAHECFVHL